MKKQFLVLFIILFTVADISAQIGNVKLPQVAKQVNLMIENNQSLAKRHIELINQNNKSASPEMKNLMDEWKTVEETDKISLKTIFKVYGFLGYSEVGEESAHNFLQMVQRFDSDSTFQQLVLVEMKKHVEKTNANPIEFAHLTSRFNLNHRKFQVYGTQLKLNEKGTRFEPKLVIDPQNLNKPRAEVDLGTIEAANAIMNEHFAAHLKNKKNEQIIP